MHTHPIQTVNLSAHEVMENSIYNDGEVAIVRNLKHVDVSCRCRTDAFAMILCTEGELSSSINGDCYVVHSGDMFVCSPDIIVANSHSSENYQCIGLFFTIDYMRKLLPLNNDMWDIKLLFEAHPFLHLNKQEVEVFMNYWHLIRTRIEQVNTEDIKPIIDALILALTYEFCRFLRRQSLSMNHANNIRVDYFKRFISILSSSYPKSRSVSYYASRLHITSKYFTVICKEVSGERPSSIINRYVMKDIEYQLHHTSKSIKEIADELGFSNSSFFGKYVKMQAGMSPTAFRDKPI